MKRKLKVDLHMHTLDGKKPEAAECTAQQLIDAAHQQGFDVLSITNHDLVTYDKYLADYAACRGILLIAGMEATIRHKHVLLYNFDFSNNHINSFYDIEKLKAEDNLCLAPHPFYPSSASIQGKFDRYRHIFDGLEFCHFYCKQINFNKKAAEKALEYGLPLVGMSDTHMLYQLGATYSLVEAEKDVGSVIGAIKQGKLEIVSQPLGILDLSKISLKMLKNDFLSFFV